MFGEEKAGRLKLKKYPRLRPRDSMTESLILAQNERWRRVLSMQVERMACFGRTEAADG